MFMTYYIGMGYDCYPAFFMEHAGLRSFSFPFDWMFAFPCTLKRSLDNNFEDWLDPKYLTVINNPNRESDLDRLSTKHELYHDHMDEIDRIENNGRHTFFNHHDVLSEDGRAMFERRIQRYKNVINSSEEVVFITSAKMDAFIETGLMDYYNDRKAKTSIVFLDHTDNKKSKPSYTKHGDNYLIEYWHPNHFVSNNFAKNICLTIGSSLRKHFGNPNFNDPISN